MNTTELISLYVNDDLQLKVVSQIDHISDSWQKVTSDNVFLSIPYLRALEHSLENEFQFYYAVVYQNQVPVAKLYFQRLEIKTESLFQDKIPNYINGITTFLFNKIKGDLLLCGNFFTTGFNGVAYTAAAQKNISIALCIDTLVKHINQQKKVVKFVLFKDTPEKEHHWLKTKFHQQKYTPFEIDVNMLLPFPSEWNTFEDYLQAMTTKYRRRAKSVLKKTAVIQVKLLSIEEMKIHKASILKLHDNVVNASGFSLAQLSIESFMTLKESLQENLIFKAYFLESKMIGFSTALLSEHKLSANYVGIDYSMNKEYPIYQKILYDYIAEAFEQNKSEINFGRTSELIKSGVGAIAEPLTLYVKHVQNIPNTIFSPYIKKIKPSPFELRKPFKKITSAQ